MGRSTDAHEWYDGDLDVNGNRGGRGADSTEIPSGLGVGGVIERPSCARIRAAGGGVRWGGG